MNRPTCDADALFPGFPLILASASPRRRQLMQAAGYRFDIRQPNPAVECGICSGQSPAQYVGMLAFRKAQDIARQLDRAMIVAADTVAVCQGQILGKPSDREHAGKMLKMLAGTEHDVLTGVCLWQVPTQKCVIDVAVTRLVMTDLDNTSIEAYLDTDLWCGKAGGFGYQDGNDWLQVVEGSETNVVGLPMERLAEILANFTHLSRPVEVR